MFGRKDKNHDSDRRAEEDPSDPGTDSDSTTEACAFDDPFEDPCPDATAGEAEGPSEPLIEVVQSDVPILAKREASLALYQSADTPFATITDKGAFGVLAKATCHNRWEQRWVSRFSSNGYSRGYENLIERHAEGVVPALNCTCGFYAIPVDSSSAYASPEYVTLLVELSGTVIEHDAGFRAEYQKVVECQVPPCAYCGSAADQLLLSDAMVPLRFVCSSHTPTLPIGYLYVDIASLSHRIGVPVTRLELPPVST